MQSNLNTLSFSIFCSRKLSDVWFLNDIHVKQKTSILIWQRFLFCEADHFAPSMLSAAYWLSDFCNVRDEPKRTKSWISSTRHAEQNQWVATFILSHQGRSKSRLMTPIKRARLASSPRYLPAHSLPSNKTISYKHTAHQQKAIILSVPNFVLLYFIFYLETKKVKVRTSAKQMYIPLVPHKDGLFRKF